MHFPTTHWTLLAVATLNGDSNSGEALSDFYRRYRQPVIAFIRKRGFGPNEAEDLAQDFVVHLLEKSMLRRADAARGRFRSFLLGALVLFLADVRKKWAREKRGGGCSHLSLDDEQFRETDAASSPVDTAVFDYEWAVELLERARRDTESCYTRRGRVREFDVLRAYLPGGIQPPPYEEAASSLSMTLGAFKTEVHRLRARFRDRLRHEITATVHSPHEIGAEIAYLGQVLQHETDVKPAANFV